jgi:hypothetical protein
MQTTFVVAITERQDILAMYNRSLLPIATQYRPQFEPGFTLNFESASCIFIFPESMCCEEISDLAQLPRDRCNRHQLVRRSRR